MALPRTVMLRLTEEDYAALKAEAKKRDRGMAYVAREYVRAGLAKKTK